MSDGNQWTLLQRFQQSAQTGAFKHSDAYIKFLAEFSAAYPNNGILVTETEEGTTESTVTTAIMTHVKPGMEKAYRDWEGRVQAAQAKSPGFRGTYFQPDTGESGVWVSLLRFDTSKSLDRWIESLERKELLKDAKSLVRSTDIQRVTGSFPGWVPIDETTGKAPPDWKIWLLVTLGLYPIVMLEIKYLSPAISFLPSAPSNLIGNFISVAGTTWLTMPLFIKWFAPWLFPAADTNVINNNVKWLSIIIAGFALELAILWNLLSPPH